jgi:hypothetical protein
MASQEEPKGVMSAQQQRQMAAMLARSLAGGVALAPGAAAAVLAAAPPTPKPAAPKAKAHHRAKKADRAPAPAMTAEARRVLLGKASCEGDLAGVRRAVEAGADPGEAAFDWDGSVGGTVTAAYLAACKDRVDVLRFLVGDAGADPNKGNIRNGWTPCHSACGNGNDGSVRVLLELGADPDRATTDGHGFTPCMWAADNGHVACLRALREGSPGGALASVNAVGTGGGYGGDTALDIAESCNENEAAACLRDELGALRAADIILHLLDGGGGGGGAGGGGGGTDQGVPGQQTDSDPRAADRRRRCAVM